LSSAERKQIDDCVATTPSSCGAAEGGADDELTVAVMTLLVVGLGRRKLSALASAG
jgi:hypothetical protein